MRRGQRYLIRTQISGVREVKVLRRRSLAWRLAVASKRLRKREGLPADLFSRLIGLLARIAIRRFPGQHGREMEILPAEFRSAGSQSFLGHSRDRRPRAAAILT